MKAFKDPDRNRFAPMIHLFFIIVSALFFALPFLLLIMVSFTDEKTITRMGYQLFPNKFSLNAYKYVFMNPKQIIDSYILTIMQSVLGTILAMIVMVCCAYPLSRNNFKFRKHLTVYILITMLFSGGLVPYYILNTKYLGLQDNFLIYILPYMANAFQIIILRTYIKNLPVSIIESAKIDGAREIVILIRIVLPLSTPVLATVAFIHLIDRWNDWFTAMLFIRSQHLYTLQYLLQKILLDLDFVRRMATDAPGMDTNIPLDSLPNESMRFALAIVAAGPMLIVFPLFQRFFVKGLTIGSVKG